MTDPVDVLAIATAREAEALARYRKLCVIVGSSRALREPEWHDILHAESDTHAALTVAHFIAQARYPE